MANPMTNRRMLVLLGVIVVLIMGYAWLDGGREPVRIIIEPVAVPSGAVR